MPYTGVVKDVGSRVQHLKRRQKDVPRRDLVVNVKSDIEGNRV